MTSEPSGLEESEYVAQLIRDAELLNADIKKFDADYTHFWKKNLDEFGRILIAHLIIEHYLDEYLTVAFPTIGADAVGKLRFSQKLEIANFKNPLATWLPGILALNKIRNHLAHNLNSEISPANMGQLRRPVEAWLHASGRKVDWTKLDIFQVFSHWAASFIHAETNGIRRYGKGLGRVAFREWVKKSVSTPRNNKSGGAVAEDI